MSFDIATHELIDVWAVGNKISAIATLSMEEGGFIVVVGTQNGNLVFRQDWEEIIPKFLSCGTRTINDLNFSPNGQLLVAASSDKHVYLF
jgi:WD40 repeat protein